MKEGIGRARLAALCLAIATAILAVAVVQVADVASWAGRLLAATAAITAGVGTIVQRKVGTVQVRCLDSGPFRLRRHQERDLSTPRRW